MEPNSTFTPCRHSGHFSRGFQQGPCFWGSGSFGSSTGGATQVCWEQEGNHHSHGWGEISKIPEHLYVLSPSDPSWQCNLSFAIMPTSCLFFSLKISIGIVIGVIVGGNGLFTLENRDLLVRCNNVKSNIHFVILSLPEHNIASAALGPDCLQKHDVKMGGRGGGLLFWDIAGVWRIQLLMFLFLAQDSEHVMSDTEQIFH